MKCNIQDILEIDLPDNLANTVDLYNNEWDLETGQAWEMKNFIKLTKYKKTLWDVGGYIGFFSFVFLNNNNDNGDKNIRCFEPSPWNNDTFREIVKHNSEDVRYNMANVKLFSMLVGEKEENKNFLIEGVSKTFSVLYERDDPFYRVNTEDDTPWEEKEKVPMQSLDRYWLHCLEEKDKVADVIKIDVEGYEYRVFQGAINFFNHVRPLLFLEVHPALLNMYNNTILNLYDIVTKEIKYNFFDNKLELIKSKDEYVHFFSKREEKRLVCLPQEESVERIDA